MDYSTQEFFRLGYAWAPLLGFLPAAWLGTGASRGVAWLAQRQSETPNTRPRFTISRLMFAVGALGLFLAALRGASEIWLAIVGDSLAFLFIGAALWSALGRGPGRAWWFGLALVGGVDFLLWSTRDATSYFLEISSTPWPPHQAIDRLYHFLYERWIGRPAPSRGLFIEDDPKRQAIREAYFHARTVLLMGSCVPMGWLGATIAQWFERRRWATQRVGSRNPQSESCVAARTGLP